MKYTSNNLVHDLDIPLQLNISFEKVYELFEKYAHEQYGNHPYNEAAKKMVSLFEKYPQFKNGFEDFSLLEKHKEEIDLILDPLFPEPLQINEIKAVGIPFSFSLFKYSTRFESILENAGEDYEFNARNLEDKDMYIMACLFILSYVYDFYIDAKRPFYFEIPDKTLGTMKYYRAAFNGDFTHIVPTENAPKINQEDIRELLNNFDNIDLWKEKFPPNSYLFKGFVLINLFDVTAEEMLSEIKANLLEGGDNLVFKLQNNLRDFFGFKDLKLGFSFFEKNNKLLCEVTTKKNNSIILQKETEIKCSNGYFCDGILTTVFKNRKTFIISDVEEYGRQTNENGFYQNLHDSGIGSIILIPIEASNHGDLALLEIASPKAYALNSVNINKLKDIIPVFRAAVERTSEEHQNILEASIQENYTSIHSSVKWRFYEAAEKYFIASKEDENAKLDEIIFKNVYPLYGQTDIKGSSDERNFAIQQDLIKQLTLAIDVLEDACKTETMPIYNELTFRVVNYLKNVQKGLNAGDEITILDFLQREIYPIFKHIKKINQRLSSKVKKYTDSLDRDLKVVYEKRKDYEQSVTYINDKLAKYLDKKQHEAQQIFPHYFERYKTDGVEFNLYIGNSIAQDQEFDKIYLFNLRLWQLQTICEMENIAKKAKLKMKHKLDVASLILVYSNPMSIKFRMDEKRFDVDGAYNIRYEIIKKRIDKAFIKGTQDRLTVPGKIAIVYSQDKDAEEYEKYIKFLQSKNQLGKIEYLDLEELQGTSGLKALRVEVIYQKDFDEKKTITFSDIMQEINS